MADEVSNYTCAIKIFQAKPGLPSGVDFAAAPDFPSGRAVPGYLCQAARLLVGLTQQELHLKARVSKKSINDYENGLISVRVALAERLACALREAGARFIACDDYVGVVVMGERPVAGQTAAPVGETAGGRAVASPQPSPRSRRAS